MFPSLLLLAALQTPAASLDLSNAIVIGQGKPTQVLVEEIAKRTQITLTTATAPQQGRPSIRLAKAAAGRAAEGYRIRTSGNEVVVEGNDARGVLFGAGHLLRALHLSKGVVRLADGFAVETAPKYGLRGHQLGYRPKTNSYDAWTLPMWDQYIRDLAVFGTNAIELIPPRSDDDDDSPHFPLPKIDTMAGMSKIIDSYGLDVWIWYPAMDEDYSKPETVEFALKEWGEVFRKLPRIDAVFVPGGDPGHTPPKYLMALLEKQTRVLKQYHPKATMWVAPQGFSQEWLDEFLAMVRKEPAWLTGIVFGPQVRVSLAELRKAVPAKYPIRHYPDITHTIRSQYPVPDWDVAYALTEGREPINPRPIDQARIFRLLQPMTNGFLTYSEGCNDDVNKFVWSALGWNPDADVTTVLREYARYFIGPQMADGFAQGLLALERNWRGPLAANTGVDVTLRQFQAMERAATPQDRLNWRFQQALYRAYYDGYLRARLLHENQGEERAMEALRRGSMDEAEHILDQAAERGAAPDLRARVFELAEALFQSVRMQLSVERYKAIAVGRGANLDAIDFPLNNRAWLKDRFREIRAMSDDGARKKAIAAIVDWTNPGPGGFYDDLGNLTSQPHLVRGKGYRDDPAHLESSLVGFAINADGKMPAWRTSWLQHAEVLNESKLSMQYDHLDPAARYTVRVVYAGENLNPEIRLTADGLEVHGYRKRDRPARPVEFDIPQAATADGKLTLTWERPKGLPGNGRGVQVSEVWLMRNDTQQ